MSSKRRSTRLSKISRSSSVRDGGRVSIEIVVVISAVVPTVVVVGVGVVELGRSTLSFMIAMFLAPWLSWFFGSSASFGGRGSGCGFTVVFLVSWAHRRRG